MGEPSVIHQNKENEKRNSSELIDSTTVISSILHNSLRHSCKEIRSAQIQVLVTLHLIVSFFSVKKKQN